MLLTYNSQSYATKTAMGDVTTCYLPEDEITVDDKPKVNGFLIFITFYVAQNMLRISVDVFQ